MPRGSSKSYSSVIKLDDNTIAFFALVKAGLWENSQKFSAESFELRDSVDWGEVYRLASEQSVLGLVLAGIDYLPNDQRPPKIELLQWIGEIQVLEQQNQAMNSFIGKLVADMRKKGIYTTLIKGQGIAQCYERPLWRSAGDVDFFMSEDNYEEAKVYLARIASGIEPEKERTKHIGFTVDQWLVELHATMHTGLKKSVDRVIDEVRRSVFNEGNVRAWDNNGVDVFIPSPDNDIIIVFTHFLGHFCFGGIGLKQICDLCRLLWVYRDSLNHGLLESRIREMGLMTEWKAFGAFAIEYLGMPADAMPLYSATAGYKRKANRICSRILESGNMGQNNDGTYRQKENQWKANLITMGHRTREYFGLMSLFPWDATVFMKNYLKQKLPWNK